MELRAVPFRDVRLLASVLQAASPFCLMYMSAGEQGRDAALIAAEYSSAHHCIAATRMLRRAATMLLLAGADTSPLKA